MAESFSTPATSSESASPDLAVSLDQLLASAEGGGVTSLDPAAAVGIIDRFRSALAGSSDSALAGIASELESFRTTLTSGAPGGEVAEALTTLAGKVTSLGVQGGPAGEKLKQLGRALAEGAGRVARAD
jgi:hypothetical protein